LKEKNKTLSAIRDVLKDRANLIIFIIMAIAVLYAIIVRFLNLGELSFWGDDGMTYLATVSTLKHGYPLLPSGYVMYHNIASDYFNIIPVLIFGDNEFAYRFFSAFTGVLVIPLVFLFVKEISNKYIAAISSVIIAINAWQIEYSREGRYYSEFQFFYILTIYFFYLGFFKDKKVFKILAIISFFITTQIVTLGITLVFLFVPLLVYKGLREFFRRDTIISFLVSAAITIGVVLHREFIWKVGLSFYGGGGIENIANPVLRLLNKYFGNFQGYYYKIFEVIYSKAFPVFLYGGLLIIILYIFVRQVRNPDEHDIRMFSRYRINIHIPFNLVFLYFIFFSNSIFYGLGNMYNQQRYIYHINPIFIVICVYVIFELVKILVFAFRKILSRKHLIRYDKISKYPGRLLVILLLVVVISSAFIIDHIDPVNNFKVTVRSDGDPVNPLFAPSSTLSIHHDTRTAAAYAGARLDENDIVISTNPLKTILYAKQVDYWLWSGNLVSWQPYRMSDDGIYYDNFFGIPLLRDLQDLLAALDENSDKDIWVLTTDSIIEPGHVDPMVYDFLINNSQYKEITGNDGIGSAYLFPETDKSSRSLYRYLHEISGPEEVISVDFGDGVFSFLFNDEKNNKYLKYGWSNIEDNGTWSNRKSAILFLDFKEISDCNINITMKPLPQLDTVQEVEVILNGESIDGFMLKYQEFTRYSTVIPGDLLESGVNILEFRAKIVTSPFNLGLNNDTRDLAIYFGQIDIYK